MTASVYNSVKRVVKSRPVTSYAVTSIGGLFAYGFYVEQRTKRLEEMKLKGRTSMGEDREEILSLPRDYDRDCIAKYWEVRPITVSLRVASIASEVVPALFRYIRDFKLYPTEQSNQEELQRNYSIELKNSLTRLGPAFVKFGQQLSIRPDLLPPAVLKELQKLCDSVEPVSDEVAMETLRKDLGEDLLNEYFEGWNDTNGEMKLKLVASASLGQVYQGTLKGNKKVAIKVQRPDMLDKVSLDLYLLNQYGRFLDKLFDVLTEQVPFHEKFIDCFARGSYNELDYEKEAENQLFFKTELAKRKCKVYVPSVHSNLTSRHVITMDWVDGVKLADAPEDQIRTLIPAGVELFLTQMLDIGSFHADPHPGNLYVTKEGVLCLLDFGLCAEIDSQSRRAMTTAIVHLLNGDFDSLISKDAKDLGFLPSDLDITELKPVLTKILNEGLLESGSNMHTRRKKLMSISNELNEVFFKYPFSVPPFFALVTRGLGLLEGIALSGDPEFDIFRASYPFAAKIYGAHGWNQMKRRLSSSGSQFQ